MSPKIRNFRRKAARLLQRLRNFRDEAHDLEESDPMYYAKREQGESIEGVSYDAVCGIEAVVEMIDRNEKHFRRRYATQAALQQGSNVDHEKS